MPIQKTAPKGATGKIRRILPLFYRKVNPGIAFNPLSDNYFHILDGAAKPSFPLKPEG